MRSLSARTLREIRDHLVNCDWTKDDACIIAIDRALAKDRRRASLKSKRQAPKKAARREKTSAIRAACMERADNRCEHCGLEARDWALQLDHYFGGSGRRHELESVETCWMLCGGPEFCHAHKTQNMPSAEYWIRAFVHHARKHHYHRAAMQAEARLP